MKTQMKKHNKLLASVIATTLAAAVGVPTTSWAQSAEATLRGKAAPSAKITAKNVANGSSRTTTASADGSYVLVGLTPGIYRVDAGAGTERVVTLNVATTASLDLTGAATKVPEGTLADVAVNAQKLVEVKTSEVGRIVSMDQIASVPQLTRNFLEFADTVPGVVFNVDSRGKTSLRGGAQNDNAVNVYIDGVGQKGYVRSGLSGQTDNTQGNPFPQLAIGEYKVISSNYKAEYDQISSAAVTAETKSGTNEFHGEGFYTYTNQSLRAETPGEAASNRKTDSNTKEFGASIGGPLLQDQAHFFLAYEGKRYQTPATVTVAGGTPSDIAAALPSAVKAQLGPITLPFNEDLVFAKLDWEPTDNDRLVFDAKIRTESSLGDQAGVGVAASAAITTKNTDNRYALRWQHDGGAYFNEVIATYEDAFFRPQGKNGAVNGSVYTWNNANNNSNIIAVDGVDPRATQNKGQKGYALADDLTFSHLNWQGEHTIKMGAKLKWVDLTAKDAESGYNPIFNYDVTAAGVAPDPYKATFAIVTPGQSPVAFSKDRQFGVYLQDDWAVNNKLTFNLGVRYDIEWNPSYLDFVTPKGLTDAFNTVIDPATGLTYGQSLGLSTDPNVKININDYISNGHNRKVFKGEIAPRLGFSYDLDEDQKHVIFGGFGRAYDRNLYDYLQLEVTKMALAESSISFNTADHPCTVGANNCYAWDPSYLSGPAGLQSLVRGQLGEPNLMKNDLKVPYSDQFTVGFRNKVGDWNTSVALSRIVSKDGLEFVLGNRDPQGRFFTNEPWGGIGQPWTYPPPGIAANLILAKNAIETRNTQVTFSADKPFTEASGWGTTFAYTFTSATQNRDINEHYVFDGPTANVYPFIRSNAAAKHRIVATSTVKGPWDMMFGAKLTLASPIPFNGIQCYWNASLFPDGGSCYPTSLAPDNSLAIKTVDIEVTKNIHLMGKSSMYVRLDAMNVFNARNLVDYNLTNGSNGLFNGISYNQSGNMSGTPRQLRVTFGAKF